VLLDPAMLRNRTLRGGLTSFFFQYFLQAGLFFAVPLFLSVALGLSAIATGVRLLPLSITLLLAAAGVPRVFPDASPRRVVQIGFVALFAGIVIMVALLDAGAGPGIVTWPMLLAGLGVGALASQLGAVTVSSVPDEHSGEVGGIQNTVTNLGASIGTALAGAVLISALTTSFLAGVQNNPAIPKDLAAQAQVELAAGVPFRSDQDLQAALDKAGVPPQAADAIVKENATARNDGLRASLSVLAVIALIALFFSRRIPTRQPSAPQLWLRRGPEDGDRAGADGYLIAGLAFARCRRGGGVVAVDFGMSFRAGAGGGQGEGEGLPPGVDQDEEVVVEHEGAVFGLVGVVASVEVDGDGPGVRVGPVAAVHRVPAGVNHWSSAASARPGSGGGGRPGAPAATRSGAW